MVSCTRIFFAHLHSRTRSPTTNVSVGIHFASDMFHIGLVRVTNFPQTNLAFLALKRHQTHVHINVCIILCALRGLSEQFLSHPICASLGEMGQVQSDVLFTDEGQTTASSSARATRACDFTWLTLSTTMVSLLSQRLFKPWVVQITFPSK